MIENTTYLKISSRDKFILFWASFLALTAASMGFVFRSMVPELWGTHFSISNSQVGQLFGAGLWPVAITMILFSLILDKVGYKTSMFIAFACQLISVVLTITATSFSHMWWACIFAGLGHGVVEACINPLCASIYRDDKSKMLNILHASWPAGIVLGALIYLGLYQTSDATWGTTSVMFLFMLLPVIIYAVMFFMVKRYPIDERVESNVSTLDMLREFGGLGIFLAITFMSYEILNQLMIFPENRLFISFILGLVAGIVSGFALKSAGQYLFFIMCVIMIPLATAEIATDGWIKKLMEPLMGDYAAWAIVFSAAVMMTLRFFAGIPLKFMSPVGLLLLSSIFSIIGLFALSYADGTWFLLAFVFYAVGQTFYWPTVLGYVAEQFPKGGAMSLNMVTAMGLLTVGIFGFPFLGSVQDHYDAKVYEQNAPTIYQEIVNNKTTYTTNDNDEKAIYKQGKLFGIAFNKIDGQGFKTKIEDKSINAAISADLKQTGRQTLRIAALLPITMALAFLALLVYHRRNGGYKSVKLSNPKEP